MRYYSSVSPLKVKANIYLYLYYLYLYLSSVAMIPVALGAGTNQHLVLQRSSEESYSFTQMHLSLFFFGRSQI